MKKWYSEACTHCGKDIHPPRPDPAALFGQDPTVHADCIWIERYPVRGANTHPLTNYVCTACAAERETWLTMGDYR